MAAPRDKTYSTDRDTQWAELLTRVPHVWRIVLVLLVTLVLALLAWVVVDRIIVNEFGSMTPTFAAVAVGLLVYGVGWWALVGFADDPQHPWHAGASAVWFVAAGAAGLVTLVMLAAVGLIFGYVL